MDRWLTDLKLKLDEGVSHNVSGGSGVTHRQVDHLDRGVELTVAHLEVAMCVYLLEREGGERGRGKGGKEREG